MRKRITIAAVLVAVMVLSMAAVAVADTVSPAVTGTGAPGDPFTSNGVVTTSAKVNPKLVLTISTPDDPQSVLFADADPGAPAQNKAVTVDVDSNKNFTLAAAVAGTIFANKVDLGFSTDSDSATGNFAAANMTGAKPGKTWTDNFSFAPTWNANAGTYNGTVTYTVTQN